MAKEGKIAVREAIEGANNHSHVERDEHHQFSNPD
jgi:hypothetical protein